MSPQTIALKQSIEGSIIGLMDGQVMAQFINSDLNTELYKEAKLELERRNYRLEQIILSINKRKGRK